MIHAAKQVGLCVLGLPILLGALEISDSLRAFANALHDNNVKVSAMDSCRVELAQLLPRGK